MWVDKNNVPHITIRSKWMSRTCIVVLKIGKFFRELKITYYLLLALRPEFEMLILPLFCDN